MVELKEVEGAANGVVDDVGDGGGLSVKGRNRRSDNPPPSESP